MATLISTGGALGERRCDAKCYDEIQKQGGILPEWLDVERVQARLF